MADESDLLEAHAAEFTATERLTLRIWFDVDLAGNDDLADRFLAAGLQLEHLQSLLPHDPTVRTAAQLTKIQRATFELQRLLAEAQAFLLGRGIRWSDPRRFLINSLNPDWRVKPN